MQFTVSCTVNENAMQKPEDSTAANNAEIIQGLFSEDRGEEEYKTRCITCHSLRYIEMQPSFPRKTWEKIVDKMIKNFGAPIPDSSEKAIVNYLAEIKGK